MAYGLTRAARAAHFVVVLALLQLALAGAAWAQAPDLATASAGVWRDVAQKDAPPAGAQWIVPDRYRLVALDRVAFETQFFAAPREFTEAARANPVIVALPMPDGGVARFSIVETEVMAPELAAKFPEIRTWAGQGIDDPAETVRLDWTPQGFHGMVLSAARGRVFIDPQSRGDTTTYMSYYTRDHFSPNRAGFYEHPPLDPGGRMTAHIRSLIASAPQAASGTQLRTYRTAVAATGEYTAYHGGTVPLGQGAIVTAMNRVNGIYEAEVAVRMVLVANNDLLVYTNAGSDPYSNTDGVAMLTQNQNTADSVIGTTNYDIGHVFSTGGGGVASLGVPCRAGLKARGVTGSGSPTGDAFWVDYVAHEMGHQFGGNHTFNGTAGNCSGANRNGPTAYEPGSGSTIMAYAGICGAQDLQPNSDAYFHTISFDEIVTYTNSGLGNGCAAQTGTGNTPPVPTVPAGGFTIPANTPFELTGSATDANGDALTYNWEEFDLGAAGPPGVATAVPFFRSWNATTSPTRTFPRLSTILGGPAAVGEVLPNATRALNFRMTVRDNRAGGGGVDYKSIAFNVTTAAGPFQVTAPNTNVTWGGGSTQTVTWNVAGTNAGAVNCANVDIRLSTDGGNTFPTALATATPNDGSQSVTLPNVTTSTARIKVACSTSIFFDISNVNFAIGSVPGPTVATGAASAIGQTGATLNGTVSSNGNATTVTFQYGLTTSYGTTVTAVQSPLSAGAANAPVSAAIIGLTCNTTYHFRVVGSNSAGTNNGGDATFTTSSCPAQTVTTTGLASSVNPSVVGTPVTFTASVTGTAPTGNVVFRANGVIIAGCGGVALTGSGNTRTAPCATSALAVGTYSITAAYGGNAGNLASTSPALSHQVVGTVPGVATIVVNPYGTVTVQGATLNGNTISAFTSNVVIQLGTTPGAANSFAQIDFQGLNLGAGNSLTLRSGAAGQAVVLRNVTSAASAIDGTLQAAGGNGAAPPVLHVANPAGIAVGAAGNVLGTSGLTLDALGATPITGQNVSNAGMVDGGPALRLQGGNVKGGGAYKGDAIWLATFGSANNPVNGNYFLLNGLQLHPGTGGNVNLTLNAYGPAPQFLNLKINGNGTLWMPSAWPLGVTSPPNNNPLAPGAVRPPGTPEPAYGGGSMIVQATGSLLLVDGGTNDLVFPGAIVLKADGDLDLNGVVVNQGWTITGKQFQGIFLESPNIVSPAGLIHLYSNYPNWVNFSTMPKQSVRAFSLAANPDGSASFFAADAIIPHLNTYSVTVDLAASGGCWTCAINSTPIDVYGP
ncbi:MAG: Ig-like domain repeat protein [Burkholderiales bacterium]|nr:Ig-like domain repeat protein [Burkholderiales bacterium]